MSKVTLNDINVSYDGKTQILKGLNLEIGEGELVSLLGPSGCGKTTTLRVIAGFIIPSSGQLFVDTEEMTKVPVHKRNFGLVFQSYALFPHLSVYENVAFGLKLRKMEKAEMDRKIKEILEVCDLTEYAQRFPKQLSGGQRQRVALARALVIEPRLLLLDEPLSNLDAKLRLNMRVEIKRLQKKLGITTVFVTHDQEDVYKRQPQEFQPDLQKVLLYLQSQVHPPVRLRLMSQQQYLLQMWLSVPFLQTGHLPLICLLYTS